MKSESEGGGDGFGFLRTVWVVEGGSWLLEEAVRVGRGTEVLAPLGGI